jgi:hypothetical protein
MIGRLLTDQQSLKVTLVISGIESEEKGLIAMDFIMKALGAEIVETERSTSAVVERQPTIDAP